VCGSAALESISMARISSTTTHSECGVFWWWRRFAGDASRRSDLQACPWGQASNGGGGSVRALASARRPAAARIAAPLPARGDFPSAVVEGDQPLIRVRLSYWSWPGGSRVWCPAASLRAGRVRCQGNWSRLPWRGRCSGSTSGPNRTRTPRRRSRSMLSPSATDFELFPRVVAVRRPSICAGR
jgi:hypothetical protein